MRNRAIAVLVPFVVVSILPSTVLRGDEYRQRLGMVYARLQQAGADLSTAMDALNDAAANQVYYDAGLTAVILRAQASRQAMSDAQREIDFAQPELQRLAGDVDQKRAAFDTAKANIDAAAGEVEKYRRDAVAQFESSPAFQQRAFELLAAQRTLEGSRQMFEQWLRTTGDYAELYHELEETEEVVRAMRRVEPPDREALAMASYDWLEALNAFEQFRAEAHATDTDSRLAGRQVDEMTRLRQALIDQFNRDLAADPVYKQLVDRAGVAQSIASSAANDVNTAEAERVALAGDIDNLRALMGAEDTRLAQAAQDAAAYQTALASVGFAVQQYEADYVQLCSVVYVSRSDCDNQVRRCRESINYARGQRGRRDWENGHGHGNPGGGGGGGGGESVENERRQAQLVQQNRDERSRILAEAEAKRKQEAHQRQLSDEQATRERARTAEETERRENEKQRSQEKRDREAHQRAPVESARVVADQQPRQREPGSKSGDRRAEAQRQVEARERAEREQRQQQSRASQERRESEPRRESQAQAKADEQRRADEGRRAQESRRAEESRRADEGRKAGESERADDSRRVEESRKADESRKAEESRRADDSRRADENRRNEEGRKRDDDGNSRRQSEQRDRDRDNNFRKR